jgi:hypothetical protein
MIEPLSKRVNELGWHIQINASASTTGAPDTRPNLTVVASGPDQ